MNSGRYRWWETAVIYQIYPRSFQDSNGDGIGDLKGIQARLPYLQELGISAIWLNPIYPSPMVHIGDDIADYTDIHPMFGSMQDFLELVEAIHERRMKVILDFVPHHTSNQHPWFLQSKSRRSNPKRQWYIWSDPKPDGSPPNNWVSFLGGSAWEWDKQTRQYYLHQFAKEQPDLNWHHPDVVMNMLNAMRFWLNRGVDGFRVNAIWLLIKDAQLRDDTPNPDWTPARPILESTRHDRTANQPEVHHLIKKMRAVLDEYDERVLFGEISLPYPELMAYYGERLDECHLPFNASLMQCPFQADAIMKRVNNYESALPRDAWPNWALGNHDQPRIASAKRAGPNARLAQMLLLTLRGTPTMYYGDEIGMVNGNIPPAKYHDPQALNQPDITFSRDNVRTPMQWENSPYAGFSTVEPWLPVNRDYQTRNVAAQRETPDSLWQMVKELLAIRASSVALNHGKFVCIPHGSEDVFAYLRVQGVVKLGVALNFSEEEKYVNLSSVGEQGYVMLSTQMDRRGETSLERLKLRPHEGVIFQVT